LTLPSAVVIASSTNLGKCRNRLWYRQGDAINAVLVVSSSPRDVSSSQVEMRGR
jgi:hypothetical protein